MFPDPVALPLGLQFDTATPMDGVLLPGPPTCERCRGRVGRDYYVVRWAIVCDTCRDSIDAATRLSPSALIRAGVVGVGGALLGGGLYYVLDARLGYSGGRSATYPLALVAVVVGYIVGRSVQFGARGHRGLSLQLMALALAYVALSVGYLPFTLHHHVSALAELPDLAVRAVAAPIVVSLAHVPTSLVNVVIIAAALLPGWIMLRRQHRRGIQGPFKIGASLDAANEDRPLAPHPSPSSG